MILQIDIGNTRVKWRFGNGPEMLERGDHPRAEIAMLLETIPTSITPAAVWVASVAGESIATELGQACQQRWGLTPWFAESSAQVLGLQNSYVEPGRMGVDRWLAMLGAWHSRRQQVAVIDAGSALTIDFVAASGQHLGGYILPGMDSMERALLSDTDRVRFGTAPRDRLEPGRSTEAAVYNGLLLSQAGAIRLALEQVSGDCELVFSGGNGALLCACLGLGGTVEVDLVLDGLLLLGAESGLGASA
ncbi:type III pantothenate kinase [Halieaceae bacterium IMCC14734]|uniref:Type III pantothenate kinase n=1 Tax=Candidatus Litorirhabdus singularis TaxID=2518993 RepID=A0ABT3TAZ9_9GAMM|nr:type III pantothenate kinase [Candidatus Litorirhabdus singularis]MCX2979464.1 type III pantothenate kinase [Candidatus Litorirhabdus singularis]